jgi:hypothetical protein
MTEPTDFDWGEKGEQYWRTLGEQCKASELQIRFACARHGGASATAAAKASGYADNAADPALARQGGYRALRTTAVAAMLALANAEDEPVSTAAKVMDKQARIAKLSAIAHKSNDATLQIRSIEALNKMESEAADRNESHDTDAFGEWRMVRDYVGLPGGAVAIVSLWAGSDRPLSQIPLLHDVYREVMRDPNGPELWERSVNRFQINERIWLDKLLANKKWQIEARAKLWKEVGVDIDLPDGITPAQVAIIPEAVGGPSQ